MSPQVIFKIDPLIMAATALSERVLLAGLFWSLVMAAATFVLGRFFCGWMCPLGTLIDAAGALRKKPFCPDDNLNRKARRPKFVLLGAVAVLAVLGVQAAWVLDPIVTAARVVSLNVIPAVTWAVDRAFIWIIQTIQLYGPVYDLYRDLKQSLLGVRVQFFANSLITLVWFLVVTAASFWLVRAWCRLLCPLGALYHVFSRRPLLRRVVGHCTECGLCRRDCRMGAITKDAEYVPGECILCMDCVYSCPQRSTRFSFSDQKAEPQSGKKDLKTKDGLSRRDFLFLMLSSWTMMGFLNIRRGISRKAPVVRPPGALPEERFVDTCVRCGNCMKVCVTHGLQPVMLESGLEGLWTPHLVPEIGYCEYNCTLCGEVCPTGAIKKVDSTEKKRTRLGLARIDPSICLAWAENKECIVCEEHCPVDDKAIKVTAEVVDGLTVLKPVVDESLCVGCGICQNKCPVRPLRAIRVFPLAHPLKQG